MYLLNQTGYGYNKLDIGKYTALCWPQYVDMSKDIISSIDSALAKAASLLTDDHPGSINFIPKIEGIRTRLEKHMDHQLANNGCPCIGPDPSNPIEQFCQDLKQESESLITEIQNTAYTTPGTAGPLTPGLPGTASVSRSMSVPTPADEYYEEVYETATSGPTSNLPLLLLGGAILVGGSIAIYMMVR